MKRPCIAFKMNYCDGGASSERVGFDGICSDTVTRYNVRKVKHRWCANDRCACKKFLDGQISQRDGFICYESTLLKSWRVEVGEDADGTYRKIRGGEANHLCVLTTKYPNTPEESRFVFAMFIIREVFSGDKEEAGFVSAGEDFCLEFRPREAEQMKFWDVYHNPNAPRIKQWSTGLFRYFDDATAVKFLERAVEVKRGTPEEDYAKEFLKHYPYK